MKRYLFLLFALGYFLPLVAQRAKKKLKKKPRREWF